MKSIAFFGLARGGSSIVGRLMHILAESSGMRIRDVDSDYYNIGVGLDDIEQEVFEGLGEDGFFYGPFRGIPRNFPVEKIARMRSFVVIRDPRDVLVSRYFAYKNIHTRFESGVPLERMAIGDPAIGAIDDYVIAEAGTLLDGFERVQRLREQNPETLLYRYEDISSRPVAWVREVIRSLGMSPKPHAVNQCVIEGSFRRAAEDGFSHNRSGGVGGFEDKLEPGTLELLNRRFGSVLEWAGYPLSYRESGSGDTPEDEMRIEIDEIKRAINELQVQNGYRIEEIRSMGARGSGGGWRSVVGRMLGLVPSG